MNSPQASASPKTSIMAILALVFAFVCGPIGLILGVIAAISVGRSKGRLKGLGLAIAAIPVSIVFAGILSATSIPAFVNYTKKAKVSEANMNTARCVDSAMSYYQTNGAFPGSSQWTPMAPPSATTYAPNPAQWSVSPWAELGFSLMDSHYFQYQFSNDGTGNVFCRARGDLDGDGVQSLYERAITIENGAPIVSPAMYQENPLE